MSFCMLQVIKSLVCCSKSDFFLVPLIFSSRFMSWERFLRFKRVLFKFHFCIGFRLLHHDFGGEFSDFNLYWCRCKFSKERTNEHVYFPDNPRIHWERLYQLELPLYLSFLRVLSIYFEIKEERIGFYGQTIWN